MSEADVKSEGHAPTQADETFGTMLRMPGEADGLGIELSHEFERLCTRLGFATSPDSSRIDNRYRVEKTLGQGAMGVVLCAWDERLGRRVAVKLVRVRLGVDLAPLQTRLEREAQMLARVDHPNVISIHDVGAHEDRVYLAMQYVAGVTVRAWQEAKQRSPSELLAVYLQAARGLEAAHAGGVIHRDFKPDNMIVGDDGIVRVLDFGIAAALQTPETEQTLDGGPEDSSDSGAHVGSGSAATIGHELASLTRTGAILGTLAYMAPEQLLARKADEQCDQFAFCIALWEALAGERPFTVQTPCSPLDYVKAMDTRSLNARALPRWIRPTLLKGLSQDPAARFTNMSRLIAALERGRNRRRKLARAGIVGVIGTLGLAPAVLAGSLLATPSERERCDAFIAQSDAVWGDAQRASLDRFAEVDLRAVAYARTTLDALAQGWRARAQTRCDGEFAPAPTDPSRVCMQAWLTSFERSVTLLVERGDLQTLVHAPDLLSALSNSGDFCERAPTQPVDPELLRLVQAAREAAWVGDPDLAESLAEQALERARQQLDARSYTPEMAEAHATRAMVSMLASDYVEAEAEFALAEQQAIGAGHWSVLLPTYTYWAMVIASPDSESNPELALGHLERALPLSDVLELGPEDLGRFKLIEARGLIAQKVGRQAEAIEHHQRARALFVAANQPVLAANSLNNIGTNYHELGQLDLAAAAYREALDLLTGASVSERHPSLLHVELNLGQIAMVEADAAGLPYLLNVARLHPNQIQRIRARNVAAVLAYGTDQLDLAVELAEQALAEVATQPSAPADLVVEIELTAGVCLASKGDPRGERLVHSAERRARALPADVQYRTARTWIAWLEENGRCADARVYIEALDVAMQRADPIDPDYLQWRADQTSSQCHDLTGE
jgi:eukaryotic-like serine/threonine-protein kinase